MAAIEVRNLSKTFLQKDGKVEALKNINLCIEAGDIFGIIGMSGAGKSTLVRCLNYLESMNWKFLELFRKIKIWQNTL